MKKWVLCAAITCLCFSLTAKPYYAEYRDGWVIIVFHGQIRDNDEGEVKLVQTQYLEALNLVPGSPNNFKMTEYEMKLKQLGVVITKMRNDPFVPSENVTPYFTPGPLPSSAPPTPSAP